MRKNIWILGLILAVSLGTGACSDDSNDTDDEQPIEVEGVKVLEYCPAPGQFINENMGCKTPEEANAWAQQRLKNGWFISLGAFGGYITVEMPKVVNNRMGYDFGIAGNSFDNSSEPGIVWISDDVNGDGIANDPWYELKGSDQAEKNYEVTYYRPSIIGDIRWTDNKGNEGVVSYMEEFHAQTYYPAWIIEDSYTLKGSLLPERTVLEDGVWKNQAFESGYADNMGSDAETSSSGMYRYNQFDLDHAVDAQGKAVALNQIRFVKVQCAVLNSVAAIGEVSTEVLSFKIF